MCVDLLEVPQHVQTQSPDFREVGPPGAQPVEMRLGGVVQLVQNVVQPLGLACGGADGDRRDFLGASGQLWRACRIGLLDAHGNSRRSNAAFGVSKEKNPSSSTTLNAVWKLATARALSGMTCTIHGLIIGNAASATAQPNARLMKLPSGSVDPADLRSQAAVDHMARTLRAVPTRVVAAWTHLQHGAQGSNRIGVSMVLDETEAHLGGTEKMPIAFFKMSRSI